MCETAETGEKLWPFSALSSLGRGDHQPRDAARGHRGASLAIMARNDSASWSGGRLGGDIDDVLPVENGPEALFHAAPIGIFVARAATCRDRTMSPAGAQLLGLPDELNPSKTADDGDQLLFKVRRDGRELRGYFFDVPPRRGC